MCVNPMVEPMDPAERSFLQAMLDVGESMIDAAPPDIADRDAHDPQYDRLPIAPLLAVAEAAEGLLERLGEVGCPVLIATSRNDHVVDPRHSDILSERVTGPVERLWLERSYHVAALDLDRDVLGDAIVEFAGRVAA